MSKDEWCERFVNALWEVEKINASQCGFNFASAMVKRDQLISSIETLLAVAKEPMEIPADSAYAK